MSPVRHCLLLLAALATLAPPVFALVADRILGLPARIVLALSLPSLAALGGIFLYTRRRQREVSRLILCGLIGGLLGTVALDAVRLVGVQLGAFPMDMPRMFGIIAAGKAPQFQTNTMATLVRFIADMPEEQRTIEMTERLKFLASVDETSRRAFMGAMLKGLLALPNEKRAMMVETQAELITTELLADEARAVSESMSAIMAGTPTPAQFPSGIELFLRVPQVPMAVFRRAADVSYPETLEDTGSSDRRVAVLGYLWHFNIGATFGISYTLLFGSGSWPLALGWGGFVWLAMMVVMPVMMPMIDFPWWFVVTPFVAHMAMAIPIGWVSLRYVGDGADRWSLLGMLRQERRARHASPGG
ncbi:MAG: hypothetical protein HYY76_12170 [Acidobacteria bacterium]|nr:hypothetical protein [Acidobacteriota bacterium]